MPSLDPIVGDWKFAAGPEPNRLPDLSTLSVSKDGHLIIGQCGSKDALKVDSVTDDEARYRIEGLDRCLLDPFPPRMRVVIKQGAMEIRVTDDPAEVPYRFKRR